MEEESTYNLRKQPKVTDKKKALDEEKKKQHISDTEESYVGTYVSFEEQEDDTTQDTMAHTTSNQPTEKDQEANREKTQEPEVSQHGFDMLLNAMRKMQQEGQETLQKNMREGQKENQDGQRQLQQKMEKLQEKMEEGERKLGNKIEEQQKKIREDIEKRFQEIYTRMEQEKTDMERRLDSYYVQVEAEREKREELLVKQMTKQVEEKNEEVCRKQQEDREATTAALSNIYRRTEESAEAVKVINKEIEDTRSDMRSIISSMEEKVMEKVITTELEQQKKMENLENNMKRLTTNEGQTTMLQGQPTIYVSCGATATDINAPRFNGRSLNPLEYLNNVKRYWTRQMGRRKREGRSEVELTDLLDLTLDGAAARWWQTIRDDVESFDDFEERFCEKYWNEETQRGIRHRLDVEYYRNEGTLNRAEYFTERVLLMKNLTPRPTEDEIVRRLCEHFGDRVRDARRVQNISTIREMENFLNEEDVEEKNAQLRSRETQGNNRNDYRNYYRADRPLDYRPPDRRGIPYQGERNNNHFQTRGQDGRGRLDDRNIQIRADYKERNNNFHQNERFTNHDRGFVQFHRRRNDRQQVPYHREERNMTYRTPEQERVVNAIQLRATPPIELNPSTSQDLNN